MQVELLESGRADDIVQETRLWDEGRQCTYSMRKKEGLADYRYFPEPDLPPLQLTQQYLDEVKVCGWVGRRGRGWGEPEQKGCKLEGLAGREAGRLN